MVFLCVLKKSLKTRTKLLASKYTRAHTRSHTRARAHTRSRTPTAPVKDQRSNNTKVKISTPFPNLLTLFKSVA